VNDHFPEIRVESLTKRFGRFVALDNASFEYHGPQAIGYLGPNGAGKTTTLKALTHLLTPTSGRAIINGIDVRKDPKKALFHVGALIESPEPYAMLTVKEALEMVGRFRGLRGPALAERIKSLHEEFLLPPMERRMGALSKGQRQRVVFAGTVISDPTVLILDEPTSGLDPAERVRIRNFIQRLKKDHLILMSSHLLGEVTETCDQVIFINSGKILLKDSVAAIEDRTRSRFVEVEFLQPIPPAALEALRPSVTDIRPLDARRFQLGSDGSEEARAAILEGCQKLGRVIMFQPVGSALEDTYMQLMVNSTAAEGGIIRSEA
jgi:ABC-2 type transport system ATP-binding protein